ncbi:phage tail protein [Streptomyces sp. MNP-20]|uniref:phage tail protein n=1 Tax=Streptomyces sp. MNP-20 TaxID=2721165 RepID=UPI00155389BC|nr:phage tail protein [Streptomyces sp. MNP-20]
MSNGLAEAYPLPTYRFQCKVGDESIAFNSASGLDIGYQTIEYRDGAGNWFQMPGQRETHTITLRRGEPGSVRGDWAEWVKGIDLNTVEKRDMTVSLADESGANLFVTWNLVDAFPLKAATHDLDGDGTYEFEELVLTASRLTVTFH